MVLYHLPKVIRVETRLINQYNTKHTGKSDRPILSPSNDLFELLTCPTDRYQSHFTSLWIQKWFYRHVLQLHKKLRAFPSSKVLTFYWCSSIHCFRVKFTPKKHHNFDSIYTPHTHINKHTPKKIKAHNELICNRKSCENFFSFLAVCLFAVLLLLVLATAGDGKKIILKIWKLLLYYDGNKWKSFTNSMFVFLISFFSACFVSDSDSFTIQ
jgi:hypothetical protein